MRNRIGVFMLGRRTRLGSSMLLRAHDEIERQAIVFAVSNS
jgi:hypothetical protein